jgi:very-short-patch-repair endonuclease
MRTESEVRAYSYLPDPIKEDFLRNRKVRFARCHVYYPDLLLPDAKIVIEIDGSSHSSPKAQKHDQKKDKEFMANGYAMIRIKNEATECKTTFLYKLYYELIKISDIKDRKGGQKFVESIEDYLYAADEEEYLVDESELQLTDMLHEYTING